MVRVKSPSKINLFLEVGPLRKDGYHSIRSVIKEVPFYDVIEIKKGKELSLKVYGKYNVPEDESNFIIRGARMLLEYTKKKFGAEIKLYKNIPPGSGYGGGSSNLACSLFTLNKLWRLNLKKSELKRIALKISSDSAFFFVGKTCYVSGRGEIVKRIDFKFPYKFLILYLPNLRISTERIYSLTKVNLTKLPYLSKIKLMLKEGGYYNRFEEVVFKIYPELKEIKERFVLLGAEKSLLSGTGAGIWAVTNETKIVKRIKEEFREKVKILNLTT
ncbi:MAG: 4-(cytidine 5'-diphospho)-2-C-methyl-D-erythritol kinase [Caldiserica bacterium]|nr:MAG: 4-(cytidine 5'-diphospho)-2-C-methyl-D-erythritol kinase [Caldisericota bacterium]